MILVSIAWQTNLFFLHNTAWQASVKSPDRRPTYPIEGRAMLAAAATDHRRLKRKVAVHGTEKENVHAVVERNRMANTVDSADTAGKPALKRVIGRGMLLCFVVGDILGA